MTESNLPIGDTRTEASLRSFNEDEIIVSKTDVAGKIIYANDVFQAVSMYTESDLLGQGHDIVRHPEMPRSIFKLIWDRIRAREEVFAYIKNKAKNGDFYWVFAHISPSFDEKGEIRGYHSAQRAPRAKQLDAVAALYARILAAERAEGDAAAALIAGEECLNGHLSAQGVGYDEFVHRI